MAREMRDLDKIREEEPFRLEGRSLGLAVGGALGLVVMAFVLGLLVGRRSAPPRAALPERAAPAAPAETAPGTAAAEPGGAPEAEEAAAPAAGGTSRAVVAAAGGNRPAVVPTRYTVQVGAFEEAAGAERLRAELQRKHYPSYVRVKTVEGKTWHRVRVGPFASRDRAEDAARELEEREGLHAFVTLYAAE